MTRFPTRISSGRQPIKNNFRVLAGRKKTFVPSPKKEEERRKERSRRVPGEESRDELGGVTGGESRNNRGGVSTVESKEEVHSVQGEESVEDTESTGTTNGTTRRSRGPGGRTPELRPRSGENWPRQVRGATADLPQRTATAPEHNFQRDCCGTKLLRIWGAETYIR
ncbi:hypothetical protein NDU88_009727 [Pleurodeles waltl]|uniref:Uncharacterized protein n=1 Tax=Pleurodeles waltl TaxID=8319 RepID=A0AAV7Q071_PLEWA|nr:hypothetical protein NDU88_009727 [Pleurodeles waltl]